MHEGFCTGRQWVCTMLHTDGGSWTIPDRWNVRQGEWCWHMVVCTIAQCQDRTWCDRPRHEARKEVEIKGDKRCLAVVVVGFQMSHSSGLGVRGYLGMTGGVAARGALAALLNREEEGACCLERRLSSLSTCFITFSVSFMRACTHTTMTSLKASLPTA